MTLTEEAASTIATNSGDLTNPPAFRPRPRLIAIANDSANPIAVSLRIRPRRRSTSISRPERNSRNASPMRAQDRDGQVGLGPAQPGRADHDAEHELEHDRRQPEPREETERERGEQADRDDDQQIGVVHRRACRDPRVVCRSGSVRLAPGQTRGSPTGRRAAEGGWAPRPWQVQSGRACQNGSARTFGSTRSGLQPASVVRGGPCVASAYRGSFELIGIGGAIGSCGRS